MVVDLGYPHDFGTSWCFRFQSLPGSDLMVMVEAKQLQARGRDGDAGGVWFASRIEEKLGENTLRIQWLINVSPNSAFPPMKPLIYFSIWRDLGYGVTPITSLGKLNALKKDRKSLKKQLCRHGGKVALARRILLKGG